MLHAAMQQPLRPVICLLYLVAGIGQVRLVVVIMANRPECAVP